MDIEKLISEIEDADEVEIMEFDFDNVFTALRNMEYNLNKAKKQIVDMRTECNRRFSEQLQKIRKLEAEKMLQIQDTLFEDGE